MERRSSKKSHSQHPEMKPQKPGKASCLASMKKKLSVMFFFRCFQFDLHIVAATCFLWRVQNLSLITFLVSLCELFFFLASCSTANFSAFISAEVFHRVTQRDISRGRTFPFPQNATRSTAFHSTLQQRKGQ
jgi:hypothetical protein